MSAALNGVPVILHHTPDDTHVPDPLYAGETAWCIGPTQTKLWVGEGPPGNVNRLLLSTLATDNPVFAIPSGGPFLPLTGGTLTPVVDGTLPAPGVGLTIDSDWTAPAITLNVSDWGSGIQANCSSGGYAIDVENSSGGLGIRVRGSGDSGIVVTMNAGAAGPAGSFYQSAPNQTAVYLEKSGTGSGLHVRGGTPPIDVRTNALSSIRLGRDATTSSAGVHLGAIGFAGLLSNGVVPTGAIIRANTAEAWTTTANGTRLEFQTTPNGTTTPQSALTIDHDRRVSVWDGTAMVQLPGAAGIAEPTTTGNWLRSMNGSGSWVEGLPLAGGTLDPLTTGVGPRLYFAQSSPTDYSNGIDIWNNSTTVTSAAIRIATSSAGRGLSLTRGAGATGPCVLLSPGLNNDAPMMVFSSGSGGWFCTAIRLEGASGAPNRVFIHGVDELADRFRVYGDGRTIINKQSTGTDVALDVNNENGTGAGLRVRNGVANYLAVASSGALTVGTPTGTAITGAGNVNIAGQYMVNGVPIEIGDPDSGGPGYRCLRVPN